MTPGVLSILQDRFPTFSQPKREIIPTQQMTSGKKARRQRAHRPTERDATASRLNNILRDMFSHFNEAESDNDT